MGPTWVLSAPAGPRVGPMNLAIRVASCYNKILSRKTRHEYSEHNLIIWKVFVFLGWFKILFPILWSRTLLYSLRSRIGMSITQKGTQHIPSTNAIISLNVYFSWLFGIYDRSVELFYQLHQITGWCLAVCTQRGGKFVGNNTFTTSSKDYQIVLKH